MGPPPPPPPPPTPSPAVRRLIRNGKTGWLICIGERDAAATATELNITVAFSARRNSLIGCVKLELC